MEYIGLFIFLVFIGVLIWFIPEGFMSSMESGEKAGRKLGESFLRLIGK